MRRALSANFAVLLFLIGFFFKFSGETNILNYLVENKKMVMALFGIALMASLKKLTRSY